MKCIKCIILLLCIIRLTLMLTAESRVHRDWDITPNAITASQNTIGTVHPPNQMNESKSITISKMIITSSVKHPYRNKSVSTVPVRQDEGTTTDRQGTTGRQKMLWRCQ